MIFLFFLVEHFDVSTLYKYIFNNDNDTMMLLISKYFLTVYIQIVSKN